MSGLKPGPTRNRPCPLLLAEANDAGSRIESNRFILVLQSRDNRLQQGRIAAHGNRGNCRVSDKPFLIARGFARIFLQNAVNLGLETIVCPGVTASETDLLEISDTQVINRTSGISFPIVPLPKARQEITLAGGLIPYTRKRLLERAAKN